VGSEGPAGYLWKIYKFRRSSSAWENIICDACAFVGSTGRRYILVPTFAIKGKVMAQEDLAVFDNSNFDTEVLARDGLTVVDFWSKTCVPCKQLKKILGQVNGELPDSVVIGTVDGDENLDLLSRYGVRGFPTLMFFRDGEVVETRTGVDRRQVLKKVIEGHA
tara:strand:- start:105 stop:593 length:489 start_codon:yes stop_codon:yes gene_type:complete